MKIKKKFEFADGDFDADTGELVCKVDREHMYIDLHSGAVFDDAAALDDEICRRWNIGWED